MRCTAGEYYEYHESKESLLEPTYGTGGFTPCPVCDAPVDLADPETKFIAGEACHPECALRHERG